MKKTILFLVLFSTSMALGTPAQVIIIRHGEKPSSGDELSDRGWARAQALVQYFETKPAVTRFGTPIAIYAMKPGSADTSLRPIETVTPLAQDLGMTINTSFEKNDIKALVEEIMTNPLYDKKMVLICWEHKMINNIASEFGVAPKPNQWSSSVFDSVWKINFSGKHVSKFSVGWQHLLPGDSLF